MDLLRSSIGPEHELTLFLTGTRASREASAGRIGDLAGRVDYGKLEAHLRDEGTLALIGQRVEEAVPSLSPRAFHKSVEQFAAASRRQGLSQQMLTIRLAAALEEADIRSLPLKGPFLGERIFGDVGARASADVDLLVAEHDLPRAVEITSAFGYRRHPFAAARGTQSTLHECLVHPSDLPQVELHWRIHWYATQFSADILRRSMPGTDGYRRLNPIDELATLLLFYVRDGFAGLRLAADLGAWWDRYGADLDPAELAGIASSYPELERSLATAAVLAEQVAGVPAGELLPAKTLSSASVPAMRLANWPLRGNWGQIRANISLVDWVLAPPGDTRSLIRRHLLLEGEDLLRRWPDSGRGLLGRLWLKTGLRVAHAARVLAHYLIAGGFLIMRSPWAPLPPPTF